MKGARKSSLLLYISSMVECGGKTHSKACSGSCWIVPSYRISSCNFVAGGLVIVGSVLTTRYFPMVEDWTCLCSLCFLQLFS